MELSPLLASSWIPGSFPLCQIDPPTMWCPARHHEAGMWRWECSWGGLRRPKPTAPGPSQTCHKASIPGRRPSVWKGMEVGMCKPRPVSGWVTMSASLWSLKQVLWFQISRLQGSSGELALGKDSESFISQGQTLSFQIGRGYPDSPLPQPPH